MLDVFGLSHAYGRHKALDEVNIRLRAGEAVAHPNLAKRTGGDKRPACFEQPGASISATRYIPKTTSVP